MPLALPGELGTATGFQATERPEAADRRRREEQYGQLAMGSGTNAGHADARVDFLAREKGYTVFLTRGGGATLALTTGSPAPNAAGPCANAARPAEGSAPPFMPGCEAGAERQEPRSAALRLDFVGATSTGRGADREGLPGKVNYLRYWQFGVREGTRDTGSEVTYSSRGCRGRDRKGPSQIAVCSSGGPECAL